MSSYTIIQNTSEELRRRIFNSLASAPDADLNLQSPESDITFSPPSEQLPKSLVLSLYLYHVEVNGDLRNQRRLAVGQSGIRMPPIPLDLRYLITPLDDTETINQLIIGRIIQHFYEEPFLTSLNGTPLDDSFGGSSDQFRIMLEPLSIEFLSQLWSSLNTDFRLAIGYHVRVVAIDTTEVAASKRVSESHAAVGLMAKGNS